MIEVRNVTKRFGDAVVLKDLSFEVPDGSTVALLGLSGSGKTTALKLVCGLHLPDSGSVSIDGQMVDLEHLLELRRKIGYVIQDGGLFPHLTAYGNIELVGREAGRAPSEIRERVKELAELTQLPEDVLSRYPREISGGQRQRVGIMRALFLDPPTLLLDEPMGALDPITRSQLQTELKALFTRLRKTVLMVTHDLFEASYLADQILLLNHGQIAQAGTLREMTQNPADDFVRLFVSIQRHTVEGGDV